MDRSAKRAEDHWGGATKEGGVAQVGGQLCSVPVTSATKLSDSEDVFEDKVAFAKRREQSERQLEPHIILLCARPQRHIQRAHSGSNAQDTQRGRQRAPERFQPPPH